MYWILSNQLVDEDNDADLSGNINLELGGSISFKRGEKVIDVPVSKIELVLNDNCRKGRMTDHLSITQVYGLVFSSRLRELLHTLMIHLK